MADRVTPPNLPRGRRYARVALSLAIGVAGAILFEAVGMPLASMLGAMIVTAVAAMAGVPLLIPPALRNGVMPILGVMLGATFGPSLFAQIGDWIITFTGLVVAQVIMGIAAVQFCRRVAGYDATTAFFAGMPGAFSQVVLLAPQRGADMAIVSVAHSIRLVLIILLVPVVVSLLAEAPVGPIMGEAEDHPLTVLDAGLLLGCALLGKPFAQLIRLPTAVLTGPLILSAALHITGVTLSEPPGILVMLAQIVLGVSLGVFFVGTTLRNLLRALPASLAVTAIFMVVTVIGAYVLTVVTDFSLVTCLLVLVPGSLAEMSLIALSLGIEPAMISTHHTLRLVISFLLMPFLASRLTPEPPKTYPASVSSAD